MKPASTLLLCLLALSGCPHDLTRPSVDASAADQRAAEAGPDDAGSDLDSQPGEGVPGDAGMDQQLEVGADLPALLDQSAPLDQPPASDAIPDMTSPCGAMACPMGCNLATKKCHLLKPSNFSGLLKTVTPLTLKALTVPTKDKLEFDTTSGEVLRNGAVIRKANSSGLVNGIYWDTVKQGTGYPELSLFAVSSFSVLAGATVRVHGSRAFALYSSGGIDVLGSIYTHPDGTSPGAGGGAGATSDGTSGQSCLGGQGAGGKNVHPYKGGGGGGSRGSIGGEGGTPLASAAGGAPGAPKGPLTLSPLYGGCGGGGGAGSTYNTVGGKGGGGGGALQLVAQNTIRVSGVISAPGGGGGGSGVNGGGGGGGSGGVILLEAPKVMVNGLLAANGGGGGVGGGTNTQGGATGKAALDKALGGSHSSYANGGSGDAVQSSYPIIGSSFYTYGGGGGGGMGRIRINTRILSQGGAKYSPKPSTWLNAPVWSP